MSFEVDRYSSAWAHIALCADLTWASEPPDAFIAANQRLWAQHCRVSQALQDTALESHCLTNNNCELSDKNLLTNYENGGCVRRSVKDVIPESRLAQFYGNFYYDDIRENCYSSVNDKPNSRGFNGHGCESCDLTECWMLPEVEYWFRKLVDDPPDRSLMPRRRRQYKMLPDDFERWGPFGTRAADEATLEARVRSVRDLWNQPSSPARRVRAPSPPPVTRKMRARRRQPRRLALTPPPLSYCLEAPAQLFCDPACKFDAPSPPQLTDCQRAMGRLSASVQAVMRATASRYLPYRGTNVSRYAPTGQRPLRYPDRRYGVWWPRDHPTLKLNQKFNLAPAQIIKTKPTTPAQHRTEIEAKKDEPEEKLAESQANTPEVLEEKTDNPIDQQKEKIVSDEQLPSTSAEAIETGLRKKRLYSTVLSMSPPPQINLNQVGCIRLSQKLGTPGLIKLNPKIILPTRIRPVNVDNKFEELEKEALEQYKASDESIDTKFRELEKQAVEQYSGTSNSNTSCSSGNSAEKKGSSESESKTKSSKQPSKFQKEKSVDSVVIYSQNFPDLNVKTSNSVMNLKNFHTPPRGEKKEPTHRPSKCLRNMKSESQRAASDTDYEARGNSSKNNHKGSMRWTLHVMPPKKRHISMCVSDFSSDEEVDPNGSIKDAGPRIKNHATGKVKMSAHGGGDLHPIMRKT